MALIAYLAVLGFSFLTCIWQSYAFAVLWSWFVVPMFNAPTLSLWQAMGVALTVAALTTRWRYLPKETPKWEPWAFNWAIPLVLLVFGRIATLFV